MWEKRLKYSEMIALDLSEDSNPSLYEIGKAFMSDFNSEEFFKFIDIGFINWFFYYFYANNLDEIFTEIYRQEKNNYEIEPPEKYIDEQYKKLAESPSYEKELFNFFIEYFYEDDIDNFLKTTKVFLNDKRAEKPYIEYAVSKHNEWLERVDSSKINSNNNSSIVNFKQVSDIVEAQALRNKKALQSNNINQMVTAISLTLNIEHNFGNLISDHSGNDFSQDLLDQLSNMDMSEEDEELQKLGLDIDSLYDEMGKSKYKDEFNLQHNYYKQKEQERVKKILERNPDKNVKELESLLSPYRGASVDWKNTFINLYKLK